MKTRIKMFDILILLLISTIFIHAEPISDLKPNDYNSKYYLYTRVFKDEYSNEEKYWPEFNNSNGEAKSFVVDYGCKYFIEAKKQPLFIQNEITFDYINDFEINLGARFVSGKDDKIGVFFLFGSKDESNYHFIGMKQNLLQIGYKIDGKTTYIFNEPYFEPYFDEGDKTEKYYAGEDIRIRKYNNILYFFYGEELIAMSQNLDFIGNKIGFYVGENNNVRYHDVVIDQYFDDYLGTDDFDNYGYYDSYLESGVKWDEYPQYTKAVDDNGVNIPVNDLYKQEYSFTNDIFKGARTQGVKLNIYRKDMYKSELDGIHDISKMFDVKKPYTIDIYFELLPEEDEDLDLKIKYSHRSQNEYNGFALYISDEGDYSLDEVVGSEYYETQRQTFIQFYNDGENRLSIINLSRENNTTQIDLNGHRLRSFKRVIGSDNMYPFFLELAGKGNGKITIRSILVRGFKR